MINIQNLPRHLKCLLGVTVMAVGAGVANMLHLHQCQNEVQNRVAALSNRIQIGTFSTQLSDCKKALKSCSYFHNSPTTPTEWQGMTTNGYVLGQLTGQLREKDYDVILGNSEAQHSCLESLNALKTHLWTDVTGIKAGQEWMEVMGVSNIRGMYDSFQKCEMAVSKNPALTDTTWSTPLNPLYFTQEQYARLARTHQIIKHSVRTTCAQELELASAKLDNLLKSVAGLKEDLSSGFVKLECPQWHIPSLMKGAAGGVVLILGVLAIRRLWPF
jgi:hypothetical protein